MPCVKGSPYVGNMMQSVVLDGNLLDEVVLDGNLLDNLPMISNLCVKDVRMMYLHQVQRRTLLEFLC